MGRKLKYENPEQTIQAFMENVSDSYRHPGKDEVGDVNGRKKQELVAEEFGISKHYVSVRLHRIREKLKKHLEKEGVYL